VRGFDRAVGQDEDQDEDGGGSEDEAAGGHEAARVASPMPPTERFLGRGRRGAAGDPVPFISRFTNQRGAVAVAGAFMSIFLVGAFYHLAGVGEATVYQERLQDAADEGVFAAAVTHARAMDVVAVVNQSMVVIMASLNALDLAIVGAQLCEDFAIIQYPAGFCSNLRAVHEGYHHTASPRLIRELQEASAAGHAVVEAAPELADDAARDRVHARAGSTVRHAFLVPGPMAAQRRDTDALCALANLYVFQLTKIGMGVDMTHRLIGELEPRVGRDLPHCERVPHAGAIVTSPGHRPVGTEAFQLRMVVIGDASRLRGLSAGVRMPRRVIGRDGSMGRDHVDPSAPDPTATVAIAQAEYYSSWPHANLAHDTEVHSVEEDAFRMEWRGRLRRFRVPTGGTIDPVEMDAAHRHWLHTKVLPACSGECTDVMDLLEEATNALH
jgi:hypothetical protein